MNKIDLKYGLTKVGLPLIVTSNTPNLCFLIDTRATHSFGFYGGAGCIVLLLIIFCKVGLIWNGKGRTFKDI